MNEFLSVIFIFFLLINPIGLLPVFLSLTNGTPNDYKMKMAIKGPLVAWIILLMFGFFGEFVLSSLGISVAAFRVGGGVLLGITGVRMVLEQRQRVQREKAAEINAQDLDDIAVFPIATLFIAGPGAITAMMLTVNEQSEFSQQMMTVLALTLILIVVAVSFILSGKLSDYLPESITNVISRVLGMLVIALSVQFIFDGVKSAFGL